MPKSRIEEIIETVYGAILRPDKTGKEVIAEAAQAIEAEFERRINELKRLRKFI